jgi:hypothetical protein
MSKNAERTYDRRFRIVGFLKRCAIQFPKRPASLAIAIFATIATSR